LTGSFEGVDTYPAIFILSNDQKKHLRYKEVKSKSELNLNSIQSVSSRRIPYKNLDEQNWILSEVDMRNLLRSKQTRRLNDFGEVLYGTTTGMDNVFILTDNEIEEHNLEMELILPFAHRGEDVERFSEVNPDKYILYPYREGESGESVLIEEDTLKTEYSNIYDYLLKHKDDLSGRKDSREYYAKGDDWYCLVRPSRYEYIYQDKLLFKGVAEKSCVGILPADSAFSGANVPGFILSKGTHDEDLLYYLLAILNSSIVSLYLIQVCPSKLQGYTRFNTNNLNKTPIPDMTLKSVQLDYPDLIDKVQNIVSLKAKQKNINLKVLDYLRVKKEPTGKNISNFYTPSPGVADTILTDTKEDKDNLRIGTVDFEQQDDILILKASARYKPENPEGHKTDRWGYTETDLIPAMKFTGSEKELALIREFTKLAVDKAGGFANFRESATKTMSIVDRLEKLTLPKLDDVKKGLEKYLEQKEKAERLEEEIKETDHTIDAIVFDLYDLTEEEVEVVLDSLDTDEEEKMDIIGKFRGIKRGNKKH